MNERIRQLAEQCESFGSWDNKTYSFDKEKFAELIVRECARIARNANLEDVEGGDSAVLRAAGDQIEDYFGVE